VEVLDLRQSVVYALSNNYRVQAETVSVEYADRQVQERRGAFDPSISLAASNYRDEAGSSHPTGSGHEYSAGLSGELPTGTSYTAGVSSFDRDGVAIGSKSSSGITLSVRQNLLKGFGLSANLAPIRVAARNASISRARFEKEMSDLVTDTQYAYFDVVLALEYARVARESLELANRLYEENVRRESIQSIAGSEVYQAQAEVAARREALFEAERALGDARNYLKLLICADAASARAMDFDLAPCPSPRK
jgi:outer membrane protein TolC